MVTQAFNCPACGGQLQLRAPGRSLSIACQHCGAVLDAKDERHKLLSKHAQALTAKPSIPLGRRGTIRGEELEVVGYMRRRVNYYGVFYEWAEYLLHNPYKGFRWLVESNGHWTFLKPLESGPKVKR